MAAIIFNEINKQNFFFFITDCHLVMYPNNVNLQRIPPTYHKGHKIFSRVLNHLDKLF